MRYRLIRSTLLIVLISVVTLGVPLALLARNEVFSRAQDRLHEEAATVAAGLEDRLDAGQPVSPQRIAELLSHRRVIVVSRDGMTVISGALAAGSTHSASVKVSGATVTVVALSDPTINRAREVTLVVVALGLLATIAAVGLAMRQARRLAAPLGQLAARADSLGRGDFTATPILTGIPEVDAISRELERSAAQIGQLVSLQRDFASDAAHQLRTPLTGIGLRLEEIALLGNASIRAEANDALDQVERLDTVIASLLARARDDSAPPTSVDLVALVLEESSVWQRVLAGRDRQMVIEVCESAEVFVRREHVASVLTSLLDNALAHGAGLVTVTVSVLVGQARLTVQDEGSGVPAELGDAVFERSISGSKGTGIGLSLARSLATAEQGLLFIAPESRSMLVLVLPLDAGVR